MFPQHLVAALVPVVTALYTDAAAGQSTPLALHLTIPADSVMLGDTVWTELTLQNLTNDSLSLCVAESHYTLRGRANTTIDRGPIDGPCLEEAQLAPLGARSSRDPLVIPSETLSEPGDVIVQKRIRVWYAPCRSGDCVIEVRSEVRVLTLFVEGGGNAEER